VVPVPRATAARAARPTDGPRLGDARTAGGTRLRGASGLDRRDGLCGTCRLPRPYRAALAPPRVLDGLGQGVIPEHPANVRVFYGDAVETTPRRQGGLVGEVAALAPHMRVRLRQQGPGFRPPRAPLDTAGDAPLRLPQTPFGGAVATRIGDGRAGRAGGEVADAAIDPDTFPGRGQRLVSRLAGDVRVPAIGLANDGAGFRAACARAGGATTAGTALRQPRPTARALRAVAPLRVAARVVPTPPPETRLSMCW